MFNIPTQEISDSANESSSDRQLFLPLAGPPLMSASERIGQFLRPASGYKSPVTSLERLTLEFRRKALELSALSSEVVINPELRNATPLRWQVIANYLYREGVLKEPRIQFDALFNDEPKMYSMRLWGASPIALTDGGTDLMQGRYSRGVSSDPEEAFAKVFGEFLERYPLTLYKNRELLHASVSDLRKNGSHFLNPWHVAPTAEWQKKRNERFAFSDESIFRWVKGRSITHGRDAFMPAQMVFWNYRHGEQEPIIHYPITSGAGGMFTTEEAVLSGLYELIQRDAFLLHWYNFISPSRIDLRKSDNEKVQKMYQDCLRYAIEPHVLDITSDLGIPTCLAILIDSTGKGPAVALGGGCGRNEEESIERALSESLGVRSWLRTQGKSYNLPKDYEPFSTFVSQINRLLLWNSPGVLPRIQFLLSGALREPKKDIQQKVHSPVEELADLVSMLKEKGPEYEVFYYEATHKILETLGYHSVAVSVPALLPLYFNEIVAPLGSSRIKTACRVMGYEPAEKVNDFPHPFP